MTVASISMRFLSVQMSFWVHLEKLAPPTGQNWLVLTIYFVPASNCLLAVGFQWQNATIFQSPLN